MWSIIEYLKSPELVVRFQEWFGVKYLKSNDSHNKIDVNDCDDDGIDLPIPKLTNGIDHQLTAINQHQSQSNASSETDEGFNEPNDKKLTSDKMRPYQITNSFWFYFFRLGTELGDEIFYATMIPFWFWNIDGAVGRRVVYVWSITMYIGQGLKDIIRWPRPGRPAYQLQSKWLLEYGMPSTHAMIGVCMPFSVVLFMIDRYQFSVIAGLVLSTLWCTIICLSRIYLGMHSVLDVMAGLVLSIILLIPLIPFVDKLDHWILNNEYAPLFILAVTISSVAYYPRSDKWTPTRGDTTMTTSVAAGIQFGAWINYQFGYMRPTSIPPPHEIIWPTHGMLGLIMLRTVLGLCCVLASRAIGKSISYAFVCILLRKDKKELKNSLNSLENRDKITAELFCKYFTYCLIGINIQYLLPNVFKMLGIGRLDFYTEY